MGEINQHDLEAGLCIFQVLRTATPEQRDTIATYLELICEAAESGRKDCLEFGEHDWTELQLERGKRYICSSCHVAVIDPDRADRRLKESKNE